MFVVQALQIFQTHVPLLTTSDVTQMRLGGGAEGGAYLWSSSLLHSFPTYLQVYNIVYHTVLGAIDTKHTLQVLQMYIQWNLP